MAFEVETGTGSATANSYLAVADADTYHTDHGDSSDWSGATDASKQEALRLATQYIDAKYTSKWKGTRVQETQALAWPRYDVQYEDGWYVDSDEIPQRLKDAVAELALKSIEGDTLLVDVSVPGQLKKKTIKVGPITTSKEWVGGAGSQKKYTLVSRLLKPYLISGNRLVRS